MVLPADGHVHSEWSWDAPHGAMAQTCARAVELGLPALAFTEHADFTTWQLIADDLAGLDHLVALTDADGGLTPPPLDVEGYLESLGRCREQFPELTIISGVELGEAHRHADVAGRLLAAGGFDRVLGSLHSLSVEGRWYEPPGLFKHATPAEVVRDYLAEVTRLVEESHVFAVLAHVDYAVRYWPADAGPFDVHAFEAEFRAVLRALAATGRTLEVNTRLPLHPEVVRWWRDVGGETVTFGSDAHEPTRLAHGFAAAVDMVEAHGFRSGRHPYDIWFC
jgi:histidinol-phosphatase (PHP family)